ncbi:MAG: TetR/AcrR family transcriptional regulator [Rubrivivax sp.]|nr:TetR/AcrR family transcriptional regulator [Rubrivivax sp.]
MATDAAVRPRRKAAAADAARSALTPERWIDAATEVLVHQGIDSVRVDVLAQQLQVTRGSFYWHFRDREDLLRRVLQAWREQTTVQLTLRLERAHVDPREQLRDVISLPIRGRAAQRAARIELAIRAWARRDTMARQAVDEADGARLAYISQVFSSLGFGLAEARWRAFATYAYVVAESQIAAPIAQLQRAERDRFIEQLMRLPLPG